MTVARPVTRAAASRGPSRASRGSRARTIDAVDLALALAVLAIGLAEVVTGAVPAPLWAGLLSAAAFGLPLARRRQHPWIAFAVVYGTLVFCRLTGVSLENNLASVIPCVIMMGTIATQVPIWPSLGALLAGIGCLLTAADGVGGVLWVVFIAVASWVAGRLIRQRRLLVDELRATTDELARTRERYAALAVETERARIARELHDVVAHSVSVMVIQAGAAERMVPIDPARSLTALESIQATGRQALQELRRVLGVLREDSTDPTTAPQPGLVDIDDLVGRIRQTGLAVELNRSGEIRPLPAGVELAAYRIVQEALTNIVKHAHAGTAWISLGYGSDSLELTVADDGTGSAVPDGGTGVLPGSGQGLIGMTERAALYGGALVAGPQPGGGYRVSVRLDLAATA